MQVEEDADGAAAGFTPNVAPMTGEWLSVRAMVDRLGGKVTYGRVRGFLEAPAAPDGATVPELLGARRIIGVQGYRYPAEAVETLRALLQAQDNGLLQPVQTARWLTQGVAGITPPPGSEEPDRDTVALIRREVKQLVEALRDQNNTATKLLKGQEEERQARDEQKDALARVEQQLTRITERLDAMEERERAEPKARRGLFGFLRGGS